MKRDKSIVQKDMSKCFFCGTPFNLHVHEIFFGTANRKKSIENGLYVSLCARHHNMSGESVHLNHDMDLRLKRIGQKAFEKNHTREDFMSIFHRNYLD
jgi:hypothetical protein